MARSNFFFDEYEQQTKDSTHILSVSELNGYIESVLSSDKLLCFLSCEGEISGFKHYATSGHCYFTLKDKDASIKCVMFKGYASKLTFRPCDGMRVIITGSVSVYVKDGQYQFYVQSMRSVGEGELYAKYLQIKNRLEEEGIFSESHKKPLPHIPSCVGIVTSRSGAVYHDIMSVAKRRFPDMNFVFCHASVQGQSASKEIISAIKTLDESGMADVIIVARGGGSMEDLWCFNDEALARTIYACKTPVISAVGHETDFTICDFASDMRAATPTAAAEIAIPIKEELLNSANELLSVIKVCAIELLTEKKAAVDMMIKSIHKPNDKLNTERQRLDYVFSAINESLKSRLDKEKMRLDNKLRQIELMSPMNTLMRGFCLASDENGVIGSIDRLGDNATLLFHDGEAHIQVTEKSGKRKTDVSDM